jgi:cytochrome o ubiquinol oxidase subunit I
LVAEAGAVVVFAGIVCQIVQLAVSIRHREQFRDTTGDPWNGRTLEWSTASPPPAWNFAVLPRVGEIDAFWTKKQRVHATPDSAAQRREYAPIEVPKNNPTGFVTAFFAVLAGFALIWHIWWMAGVGLLGVPATLLAFFFRAETEVEISAQQLVLFDRAHPVDVLL